MAPLFTLQPIDVDTGSDDREGRMALVDGRLVAVLVHLSASHETDSGMWFLEAGFGRLSGHSPAPFADLDAAQAWIMGELLPVTSQARLPRR